MNVILPFSAEQFFAIPVRVGICRVGDSVEYADFAPPFGGAHSLSGLVQTMLVFQSIMNK